MPSSSSRSKRGDVAFRTAKVRAPICRSENRGEPGSMTALTAQAALAPAARDNPERRDPPAPVSNREFLERLRNKLIRLRVPISGTLEVTSRCNLRCVHCYLGPQAEQHARREQE